MSSDALDSCLGAIINEGQAELQTGPFGTMLKAEEYSGEGAPVISVGEIREGYLEIGSKTPRVSDEIIARLPRFLLRQNDIVFGRKGSTHRNALIKKDEEGFFLGSDGIRLRVSSESICPKYLSYQLRSARAVSWLKANSEGTTMPSLNQDILSRFPITLLPVADQKAIAHILGTLDEKIELNRKTNETLEAMAKALFKSWFVDFDPVRAKAEGRPTGLPDEISDLFPDSFEDSELGEIPSGWRVGCLSDCCEITMGQSPPGDTYNEDGDGLPFYQGKTDFGFRFPGRRIYCSAPTRQASIGSTLISVRAPVGSANIVKEVCSIGRGIAALKSRQSADSFVYYLIGTLQGVFESYNSEGTVFGAINGKDLASIQIVVPSTALIAGFNSQCSPLDESIQSNTQETEHLATIRDALLPKLISGEIRIPNAEKMLEEVGV